MAFMLKKSRSILLIVVAVALAGCTLSPTPQQRAERLIASGEDSIVELQQELAAQRAVPLAQDGKLGELNKSMVVVVEQTELWLNQYRQWLLQYPQLYLLLHDWQQLDETEASLQQRLEALNPAEVDALVTELKAQSSFTATAVRWIRSGAVERQQVENNLHDRLNKDNEFYHLGTELN